MNGQPKIIGKISIVHLDNDQVLVEATVGGAVQANGMLAVAQQQIMEGIKEKRQSAIIPPPPGLLGRDLRS